ncbi:MAG TPA: DUF5009 domain-containing protein, partial [Calditrichia bacterium]|nr:DUF5009 domain-containing protein [Calditrichia bacterium]
KFDLAHIRIPGVLQRIALCYGIAAVLFLNTGLRGQIGATVAILLGYWGIMVLIPTPGYAAGDLTVEGNLAAHVDRFFLYGHLYKPTWDPEGLLSTLPAIATTLSGILAGHWLRSGESKETIAGWLFVGGWIAIVAGLFWGIAFPINKNLWTSSYVVFTAGAALQFLGFCYWLIDVQGIRRWAWPAIVYGSNAIAVFVLSGVLVRILIYTRLGEGETSVSLKTWLYQNLFLSWASPVNASLAFAVANVLFWLMIMAVFYRKKIFIKI